MAIVLPRRRCGPRGGGTSLFFLCAAQNPAEPAVDRTDRVQEAMSTILQYLVSNDLMGIRGVFACGAAVSVIWWISERFNNRWR